jgi:hypothetical protein
MIEVGILFLVLAIKFKPALRGLSYTWLDEHLHRREDRWNRWAWIVQLSVLLVLAACLYARLDTHTKYLGYYYARLSENPFAFDPENTMQYRPLTPFISYCLGLRGRLIILTNLIITGVTIGVVYAYFRNRFERPGDAFLAVVTITFSLVVLTSIHCGGYCDILTYLLIFLMWQHRSRRTVFYFLFLLGLLNRESIVFLIPWFAFISLQGQAHKGRRVMEVLVGFGLALAIYYLFRLWLESHTTVQYSASYYLSHLLDEPMRVFRRTFYYHGLGIFSVFKGLWIFPAAAALSFWKDRQFSELAGMALLVVCSYAQLLMAGDTSRMFTLGFMIMIIALCHLLETNRFRFRDWAFWAVAFNLMIPQVYTAATVVECWQSFLLSKIN